MAGVVRTGKTDEADSGIQSVEERVATPEDARSTSATT